MNQLSVYTVNSVVSSVKVSKKVLLRHYLD